jgi:hypothetical protein
MAKRQYREALENPTDNKTIQQKKDILKNTVYERINYKKSLRRFIQ